MIYKVLTAFYTVDVALIATVLVKHPALRRDIRTALRRHRMRLAGRNLRNMG